MVIDKTELMPYWGKRWELSSHDGCLLWGNRVVIPTPGQADVLHEAHPGFTRLKRLARTFDIEVKVVVWNARVFNLHLASSLEVGTVCGRCKVKGGSHKTSTAMLHPCMAIAKWWTTTVELTDFVQHFK